MLDRRAAAYAFGIPALAAVTLAAIWLTLILLLQSLYRQSDEDVRDHLGNLARVFEEHAARIIRFSDASILALRASEQADPAGFELARWLAANPLPRDVSVQIGLVAADGTLRATSVGPVPQRIDLSDRPHFRVHVESQRDELYISAPVVGRASGQWSIQLTRSIRRADGAFAGIITYSIDPLYLSRFYESVDLGSAGTVMLVGSDGIVRARAPVGTGELGQDLSRSGVFAQAFQRSGGFFAGPVPPDGEVRLVAVRKIEEYPLWVVVGMAEAQLLAGYRGKRDLLLAFGGFASVLCIAFAAVVVHQIRRQRQAEEQLRRQEMEAAGREAAERVRAASEHRFRAVTEAADDGIIVWDANGRIVLWNRSAERMFGVPEAGAVGRPFQNFFAAKDGASIAADLAQLAARPAAGLGRTLQLTGVRADGTRFPAEASLSRWSGDDEVAVTMIVRDVTERLRAETERKDLANQIFHAQKMEALGTLAGGVAHDFNNVLGAMQGFIWLARRDAPANSPLATYLDKAAIAGDRAARVVKLLLDYSRSRSAEMDAIDLSIVAQEALEFARASLGSNVEIERHIPEDAVLVRGDPTLIHQGLLNLLINAAQAIGERAGRIEVRLDRVDISGNLARDNQASDGTGLLPIVRTESFDSGDTGARMWLGFLRPGPHARLTVADTGSGMSEAVMRRMFEPFFTTKPVGQGTGLGLAALHGTVQSHRGGVVVESHVGRGTRFDLLFPIATDAAEDGHAADRAGLRKGAGHVLVVDDEPDMCVVLAETLRKAGYVVEAVGDPEHALDLVRRDPSSWDLVVADVTMPRLTGDQLALSIRSLRPNLPIILCTGRTDRVEALRRLPVAAVLTKPIFGADLTDAVGAALKGKTAAA